MKFRNKLRIATILTIINFIASFYFNEIIFFIVVGINFTIMTLISFEIKLRRK